MILRTSLCCVFFLLATTASVAETPPELRKALDAHRAVIAGRKLAEFGPSLDKLKALPGDAEFQAEVQRLELLTKYVKGFWEAVDRGAAAALNAGELMVDGVPVAVVDYDRRLFVIRAAGQNKRYTVNDLPAKLALVLAQLEMKKESANNKVYFGAFLALDAKGDRRLARAAWEEAGRGGVDVAALLPELEIKQVAPSIALPELSGQAKTLLNPSQWILRKRDKTRVSRDLLGKLGKQNSDGQLEISPVKGEDVQIIFKPAARGDFRCIMYLASLPAGRTFGFYGPGTAPLVSVDLPAGDVKVEFRRADGKITIKVNELAVDIAASDEAARAAGNIGVSVSAESPTIIAGLFVEGSP